MATKTNPPPVDAPDPILRLGAVRCRSVMSSTCWRARPASLIAVTATGVLCSFSLVRRAVTTMSCNCELSAALPSASCAQAALAKHVSSTEHDATPPKYLFRIVTGNLPRLYLVFFRHSQSNRLSYRHLMDDEYFAFCAAYLLIGGKSGVSHTANYSHKAFRINAYGAPWILFAWRTTPARPAFASRSCDGPTRGAHRIEVVAVPGSIDWASSAV